MLKINDVVVYEHTQGGSAAFNGALGRVVAVRGAEGITINWFMWPPGTDPKMRPNPHSWNIRVLGNLEKLEAPNEDR